MLMPTPKKSYFYITVKPNSAKSCLNYNDEGKIEAKIAAPPIDGKANKAVIELLASTLKLPKSTIYIDKGSESKIKKIVVTNISQDILDEILEKRVKNI